MLLTSLFSTSLAGILSPECEGQLLLRGCVIWSNDSATGKVINNVQVEYKESLFSESCFGQQQDYHFRRGYLKNQQVELQVS